MRRGVLRSVIVGLASTAFWMQPSKGADTLWSVPWTKSAQNPVVVSSTSLGSPCVIYDNGVYKMWLCGENAGGNIKYCTSSNGTNWTPLATAIPNGSFATWEPWVIKDGGTYRMWYRVHSGTGRPGDSVIMYTTSSDGVSWTPPVTALQCGSAGAPDSRGATKPVVLKEGGTFRMWYAAATGVAGQTKVGYATSTDGQSWQKQGTVFAGDGSGFDAGDITPAGIYKEGEYYYLLYAGWSEAGGRLGFARSKTGADGWERKADPIINLGGSGDFDNAGLGMAGASIVKANDEYRLYYPGRASSGPYAGRTSIGLVSAIGTVPARPVMPIPALRDCVAGLRIGAAVTFDPYWFPSATGAAPLWMEDQAYRTIVESQFNVLTPDNAGKWENMQPDQYVEPDYTLMDKLCVFAKSNPGYDVHGHTLVWHAQVPQWLRRLDDDAEKEMRYESRVYGMVSRFNQEECGRAKIKYWHVVNEAFVDYINDDRWSSKGHDYTAHLRRYEDGINRADSSQIDWSELFGGGDDYIHHAFAAAQRAADDPSVILIYNDFNITEGNHKATAVKALIRNLLQKNPHLSGRLGVGFQSHFHLHRADDGKYVVDINNAVREENPKAIELNRIEKNLREFAEIDRGRLKLFITELDVNLVNPEYMGDPKALNAQGDWYRDFVSVVAAIPNVEAIQTWGFTDKYAWRNYPLLWTKEYTAKPSLWDYWCALLFSSKKLVFRATCPVDLRIEDPLGRCASKQENAIPSAEYFEADVNGDGSPDDFVIVSEPVDGSYSVTVIPNPTATSQDRVTLSLFNHRQQTVLLDDVLVSQVPGSAMIVGVDRTPPQIDVQLDRHVLAPADGRLIPVAANVTTQDSDSAVRVQLTGIVSSCPYDNDYAAGVELCSDDRQFLLRASVGDALCEDKVYTITYSASDSIGNVSSASAEVIVRGAQSVNGAVVVTLGRVSYDRLTRRYNVDATVRNTSAKAIGVPVLLVIDGISDPSITAVNPDGTTSEGKPYINLSSLLTDGRLDPGESITKRISFNNPKLLRFTFTTSIRGVVLE